MKRIERYKFLSIFGDGNSHTWFNITWLGVQYLKTHQTVFEKFFKEVLENGLIYRVETQETKTTRAKMDSNNKGIYVGSDWKDYEYKISPEGDKILRYEQITRAGDSFYYNLYDRSLNGSNGLNRFAPLPKGIKPIN